MAANEKVDVVVVGAGASGSVYAAVMAKQGKKVVVLEQGPDWQLSDLISSDIWGRRVKHAGGPFRPCQLKQPQREIRPRLTVGKSRRSGYWMQPFLVPKT
jgi:choline dehydrogenase-like flavoprotein